MVAPSLSALDALDALLNVAPTNSSASAAASSSTAAVAGMIDMMDLLGSGTGAIGGGSSRPTQAAAVVSDHKRSPVVGTGFCRGQPVSTEGPRSTHFENMPCWRCAAGKLQRCQFDLHRSHRPGDQRSLCCVCTLHAASPQGRRSWLLQPQGSKTARSIHKARGCARQ